MAISFVGSYVGTHAATSAQNVVFADTLRDEANLLVIADLLEDDLVVISVENASTVNRTQAQLTPSGYTAAHTDDYQSDSNDSNFLVSYKKMTATPDTSVDIPASNATTAGVAYTIYVLRGVDPTTPMDVTPVVTGGTNTGVANANAITPVTAGAWIMATAGAAVAAGAFFTNPSGMSTTTNHFKSATTGNTLTYDANIGTALYTAWTSGAYDPAVFGGSTSTNTGSWSAVTLAFRPVLNPVSGTMATTESPDTLAATGEVIVSGTMTLQEVADSFVASGTVSDTPITGTLAAQESADSLVATGNVIVSGTLDVVESPDGFSGTGKVVVSGVLVAQEQPDSLVAVGDLIISGTLSAQESGDLFSATGQVLDPGINGTLAVQEESDTLSASGDVVVSGTMTAQESVGDTLTASGDVIVSGSMAIQESPGDTFAAIGAVVVSGTMATQESADTLNAVGEVAPVVGVGGAQSRFIRDFAM